MTHFRTQLRTQTKTIVDTALAADNATTYINRVAVIEEDKLPVVVISTDFDRRQASDIHNGYQVDIDMTLTVYQKSTSGVDTALDALCAKIETAIQADTTIDAIVELQSTNIEINDADQITGQAAMTYLVTLYGVDDPEIVI